MDLSLDDVLVGRILGRITPIKEESGLVKTDIIKAIDIHLVGRDNYLAGRDNYHLMPTSCEITDVFINTAHRAVPVAYITTAPADEPMFWSLKIGGPSWVMANILYLPTNALRPLGCFEIKRVRK